MDGAGVCHYHVVEAPLEKEYVILLRMMSMMVMEVVIPAQSWPECMLRLEWIIEKGTETRPNKCRGWNDE